MSSKHPADSVSSVGTTYQHAYTWKSGGDNGTTGGRVLGGSRRQNDTLRDGCHQYGRHSMEAARSSFRRFRSKSLDEGCSVSIPLAPAVKNTGRNNESVATVELPDSPGGAPEKERDHGNRKVDTSNVDKNGQAHEPNAHLMRKDASNGTFPNVPSNDARKGPQKVAGPEPRIQMRDQAPKDTNRQAAARSRKPSSSSSASSDTSDEVMIIGSRKRPLESTAGNTNLGLQNEQKRSRGNHPEPEMLEISSSASSSDDDPERVQRQAAFLSKFFQSSGNSSSSSDDEEDLDPKTAKGTSERAEKNVASSGNRPSTSAAAAPIRKNVFAAVPKRVPSRAPKLEHICLLCNGAYRSPVRRNVIMHLHLKHCIDPTICDKYCETREAPKQARAEQAAPCSAGHRVRGNSNVAAAISWPCLECRELKRKIRMMEEAIAQIAEKATRVLESVRKK